MSLTEEMSALDTSSNDSDTTQHWGWKGFLTCYIELVMSISKAKDLKPLLVIAVTQITKIYKQAPGEWIKATVKMSSVETNN